MTNPYVDIEKGRAKNVEAYRQHRLELIAYHTARLMETGLSKGAINKMVTATLKNNKFDETEFEKAKKAFSNQQKRNAFISAMNNNLEVTRISKSKILLTIKLFPLPGQSDMPDKGYYGYILHYVVKPCGFKEKVVIPLRNNPRMLEKYSRVLKLSVEEFEHAHQLLTSDDKANVRVGFKVLEGAFGVEVYDKTDELIEEFVDWIVEGDMYENTSCVEIKPDRWGKLQRLVQVKRTSDQEGACTWTEKPIDVFHDTIRDVEYALGLKDNKDYHREIARKVIERYLNL